MAPRYLGQRYAEAAEFLAALEEFWGPNGFRRNGRCQGTFHAACPACKSKQRRGESLMERYPLVVVENSGGWSVNALCGCNERVILDALANPGARRLRMRAASQVLARPVRWLLVHLVPLSKVTVVAGPPGLGKSLLAVWLGAMVSAGTARGDLEREPADVLLASAEDDPEDTIKPRLMAAGADLERVRLIDLREEGPDGLPVPGLIQLPRDAAEIKAAVLETGAKLVVLDPVVAFLSADHSAYREQEVRHALAPLQTLAEETGCAVVVVMHLNKAEGADPLRRIGNSGAFTALARSVLLLGPDPEDEAGNRRVLAAVKGNLRRPETGGLALRIVPRRVEGDLGEEIETAAVEVLGASQVGAEDLLGSSDDRSAQGEAMAWLRDLLGAGPVLARDAWEAAERDGHAKRTVERAKKALGVRPIKRGGAGAPWEWALRDEPTPSDQASSPQDRGDGGLGGLASTKPNEGREGWRPYVSAPGEGPKDAKDAKDAEASRACPPERKDQSGGEPEHEPTVGGWTREAADAFIERAKRVFPGSVELAPTADLSEESAAPEPFSSPGGPDE